MERNSAGRLLRLLRILEQSDIGQLNYSVATNLVGTPIDNLPTKDASPIAYQGMRVVQDAYEEFTVEMREHYPLKSQAEVLLEGLEPLQQSIYQMDLSKPFQAPKAAEFKLLEACAKGLPEENEIPPSEFDQLREGLQTLRDLAEKVKPALRKVLLELIRVSEDAIAKYEIRGAAGMKKALKQMWGELAEIWRVETPDKEAEVEKDTVLQAAKAFVMKFDNVFAKAVKYRPLLEYVLPALLNGPS